MPTSIICIFVLPFYIGLIIASPVGILASSHKINANGENIPAARIRRSTRKQGYIFTLLKIDAGMVWIIRLAEFM